MQLKIPKQVLINNLKSITPVTESSSALVALSSVYVEINNKEIILIATNLKVFVKKIIKCSPTTIKTKFLIHASKFMQVLQKISNKEEDEIDLEFKESKLIIKYKETKFQLPLLEVKDYPTFPNVKGIKINIESNDFRNRLPNVSFACAIERSSPALCGVLFDFTKKSLNLIATNGIILAVTKLNIKTNENINFIIPKETIDLLIGELSDTDLEIIINDSGLIQFKQDNLVFVSMTIQDKYPNYKSVIPTDNKNNLKLPTNNFINLIDRASLLTTLASNSIKMDILKGKVAVSKSTPDLGSMYDELKVDYKGKEIKLVVNPEYLLNILSHIQDKNMEIRLKDKYNVGLIKTKNFIYLFLPIMED